MALIDHVEMLGIGVEEGLIDRSEAARLLVEYSDGGLTLAGAHGVLDRHRTYRRDMDALLTSTERMLSALTALQTAETEQDRDAALTAMQAVQDQMRAKAREDAWRMLRRRPRRGGDEW